MKLLAPCQASDFVETDITGKRFQLSDYNGQPILLSFFRDAACPFCNMRVFELTKKYKQFEEQGIKVVAIFSSSTEEVNTFVAKHPRPFITIGDPELKIYELYGIEKSLKGFLKAIVFKIPRIIAGLLKGAQPDKNNPHGTIIPADFLIGPNGKIVDLWYGRDASDHIPMRRLDNFIERVRRARQKQSERVLKAKQAVQHEALMA